MPLRSLACTGLTLEGIVVHLWLYIHHISLRVPYGVEMIAKLLCKCAQSRGKVAHTTRNNLLLCCRPNPLPFLSFTKRKVSHSSYYFHTCMISPFHIFLIGWVLQVTHHLIGILLNDIGTIHVTETVNTSHSCMYAAGNCILWDMHVEASYIMSTGTPNSLDFYAHTTKWQDQSSFSIWWAISSSWS